MPAIDDARATSTPRKSPSARSTRPTPPSSSKAATPTATCATLGADAPHFTPEELKTISTPLDFVGINIYTTQEVVPADTPDGFLMVPRPATYPARRLRLALLQPAGALLDAETRLQPLGTSKKFTSPKTATPPPTFSVPDGRVILDTDRILYLRNYLSQLQRGIAEGNPVAGYFLWSLLDNFEWGSGYSLRFGITYVDFATQNRTPKLSYDFYRTSSRTTPSSDQNAFARPPFLNADR